MRADAIERRRRLIVAGREQFAERGYDVSLEAVAEAAGVGIATLYRNFPTRLDLKIAILTDGLETSRLILDELRQLAETDASAAMIRLARLFMSLQLGAMIPIIVRDQELIPPELIEARQANFATVAEIIERAKSHGAVAADITLTDFLSGVALITRPLPAIAAAPMLLVSTDPNELVERILSIFVAGLRPSAREPYDDVTPPADQARHVEMVSAQECS
ncbi:TetR/AcrR family transcriptional regulator [Williamsia soli]|uniref:TetR/AcrR family transcriptional regulator n=1 Tax=Williamsia soli TaxID=364929 RepID=UPI001A9E9B9A|nr:TetR/AcrR family transcriptional regulator [Williamsia soli]